MDALSTPVSSLRINGGFFLSTNPRDSLLFRLPTSTSTSSIPPPYTHLSNKPKPSSLSHPSSLSTKYLNPLSPSPPPPLLKPTTQFHRKASTGYAAALLDVARCNDVLDAIERDVSKFRRMIRPVIADPFVDETRKGEVVKGVVKGGGFYKHLVVLANLLVGKRKVGIVGEVMEEFERLYDELSGTRVVLVSSEKRIGEGELFGIAKKVQKMSGAVKVKVRNLVCESTLKMGI